MSQQRSIVHADAKKRGISCELAFEKKRAGTPQKTKKKSPRGDPDDIRHVRWTKERNWGGSGIPPCQESHQYLHSDQRWGSGGLTVGQDYDLKVIEVKLAT